jgi:hypothetical protein
MATQRMEKACSRSAFTPSPSWVDAAMGMRLVITDQTNTLSRLLDRAPEWLTAVSNCISDLQVATDTAT